MAQSGVGGLAGQDHSQENDEQKQYRQRADGTGRATLEEVARLAGVSTMTASRALSQPQLVSEATRGKVERAVLELGYVPNRAARALASNRRA
jgi:LacI family gluconate utilization system Gnt-I transcriptional repressor